MEYTFFRNPITKYLLASALALGATPGWGQQASDAQFLSKTDTATVPKEIENPECLGLNKEASHATLMPYGSLPEALAANRRASSFSHSLNGMWKFHWVDWPQKRPVNFYKPAYDVSGWKDIKVPSNFQVAGYGTPNYSNFTLIFKNDFPRVMGAPSESTPISKSATPWAATAAILPCRRRGRGAASFSRLMGSMPASSCG
jgi:beta-galactosidase